MMTQKEKTKMRKLEIENERLKEKIDHHFKVYAKQLHEVVEMGTRLQMIQEGLGVLSGIASGEDA